MDGLNLKLLTEIQVLNFFNKYNQNKMPPPLLNTLNVRPVGGKGKGKKKKKNATQQPAFIPRLTTTRTSTGLLPHPRGPTPNQPRPPAPQTFTAPHHQQDTLIDLTDDHSPVKPGGPVKPVTYMPTGVWKPLGGADKPPAQSNPPKKAQGKQQKQMQTQKKTQKTPQNVPKQTTQTKNQFTKVNTTNQQNVKQAAVAGGPQGKREIQWVMNLVEDSDDEKPRASTSSQGKVPIVCVPDIPKPKAESQAPIQAATDVKLVVHTKQEPAVQRPANAPGTSVTTGPVLLVGKPVKAPSARPNRRRAVKNGNVSTPAGPMHLNRALPAGIPRSFLTPVHIASLYGPIEPQASIGQFNSGPQWIPNPGPYEPQVPAPMYVQTNVPSQAPQQYSPSDVYDDSGVLENVNTGPQWIPNPGLYEPQAPAPMYVQTNVPSQVPQQYSPSDVCDDSGILEHDHDEGSESSSQSAQKRLSAFQRLGPVTQPKKPKLTINIQFNKDQEGRNQAVREVVDETVTEEKYIPVHSRPEVADSADETVARYLPLWPWKRTILVRKSVQHRNSRSVMILEQEQMEEAYEKESAFFQVSARGHPPRWAKEDVLDAVLDAVRGRSCIPCFVEFTSEECKFLVIRCRAALTAIHKLGFSVRKDDVELAITISQIDLTINHVDFVPRLILRKRLAMVYDGERILNLKEFTLKPDISNFIYFPLSRLTNQTELVQLQSTVAWDYLTDLDLSHNRLTSLDGFDLPKTTPKLKHLDVSFNRIERVTTLLRCRDLALRSLKLEGNPLCHDYTDPRHYVKVVKMIFSGLVEIDGLPIHLKGDPPEFRKNYSPEDACDVAERFLEVFFPLLDLPTDERDVEDLYDEKAVMTVTYRHNLRYSPSHRYFRNLFLRARTLNDGEAGAVEGAPAISRLVAKWPRLQHDPYTLTTDVMHHSECHTILRVSGILKLTSDSLAEDEHLLAFTRTLVLVTPNGAEYKILNEMLYWEEATRACAYGAFQMNSVRLKRLSLKFEMTPDKDLQEKITEIFMELTDLDKSASIRCLEMKEWNLKSALEHFIKLLKLNELGSLRIREE